MLKSQWNLVKILPQSSQVDEDVPLGDWDNHFQSGHITRVVEMIKKKKIPHNCLSATCLADAQTSFI